MHIAAFRLTEHHKLAYMHVLANNLCSICRQGRRQPLRSPRCRKNETQWKHWRLLSRSYAVATWSNWPQYRGWGKIQKRSARNHKEVQSHKCYIKTMLPPQNTEFFEHNFICGYPTSSHTSCWYGLTVYGWKNGKGFATYLNMFEALYFLPSIRLGPFFQLWSAKDGCALIIPFPSVSATCACKYVWLTERIFLDVLHRKTVLP